jgi:hypothetical protein
MKKSAFIAAFVAGCVLLATPGLFGQVKTQSPPPVSTSKPLPKPDIQAKPRPDLVAVAIEFKDLKSHMGAQGQKRYSCLPLYTFKNSGPLGSGTFDVIFEYQDPVTKVWNFYLTMAYQATLGPGETRSFGGQPVDECGWDASAERPTFRLRLDFNHKVAESDENNNELVRQVPLVMIQHLPDYELKKKID